jgi:hypothetical protein
VEMEELRPADTQQYDVEMVGEPWPPQAAVNVEMEEPRPTDTHQYDMEMVGEPWPPQAAVNVEQEPHLPRDHEYTITESKEDVSYFLQINSILHNRCTMHQMLLSESLYSIYAEIGIA